MEELKYWQAVNRALHEEMARDERVIVVGEDVGAVGGAFGASRGLQEKYGPMRVRDTPISELGLAGLGVGSAIAGLRPVVEIMFFDFIGLAMDQIANQAAKISFMSQGRLKVPLTIRTLCGGGRNNGPQHSQNLEAWVSHVPGLKVVWGSTPADARGLLKAAIRDDNPVVVIESLVLWTDKGQVSKEDSIVPIGKADVKRAGRDVTIVTAGGMVPRVLLAAEVLSKEGVEAEVIDLRTLSPIDRDTIIASVSRTHRLVTAHDAVKPFGFGAEVAAIVAEEALQELEAPIRRVAAPWAPIAQAANLEKAYFPDVAKIVAAVKALF